MKTRALAPGLFVFALLASAGCTKLLGIDKDYVETKSGSSSSSSSGAGGNATTTSAQGGGGGHVMLPCTVPTECPGAENECAHRVCEGGFCGVSYAPSGTVLKVQNSGDCQKIVCDGKGLPKQAEDAADVPLDSNPCTNDLCSAGVPGHSPAQAGVGCGDGLSCDGAGNCAGCTSPGDCPGEDTECQKRSCTSGVCGFIYTLPGTAVTAQTAGDCKANVCNGSGQVSMIAESGDPENDDNECTIDGCSNGSPTHSNAAAGAPCTSGGDVCNGAGACVECLVADTCPGQNDECQSRTCDGGKCGMSYQPSGKPVSLQPAGDCKTSVCNGSGGLTTVADNSDVHDDGNPCTSDSCNNGAPTYKPVAQGTSCGPNKQCDSGGNCVGCISAGDCPGQDNDCQSRTCTGGVCGMNYVPSGTPVGPQAAGDCKLNVCNGAGAIVGSVDNADKPVDGLPCTSDVCSNGTPSNPPAPAGTTCGTSGVCNGAGSCGVCVPGDFKFCCAGNSAACCYERRSEPPESESMSSSDEAPDLPPCCCEGTSDCDASGHWSTCY